MSDTHVLDPDFDMSDPAAARRAFRTGAFTGNTAGIAPCFTQGNLAILPADLALDLDGDGVLETAVILSDIRETGEAAARRELREETGLETGALTELGEFAVSPDPGAFVITVFAGVHCGGDPVADDDAAEAEFVAFPDLLNRRLTPGLPGWAAKALMKRMA